MNDTLSTNASQFLVWIGNKQKLEEIITQHNQIIKFVEQISPSTIEFSQLQHQISDYKQTINSINPTKLPSNQAIIVTNAKEAFDKIVAVLYRKYDLYAYEEVNIPKIIEQKNPQSTNLQFLISACNNYTNTTYFDSNISNWPKINELYLDLATLSSIQQENKDANYLTKYSSINTATELQTFKTTLETALLKENELKQIICTKNKIKPNTSLYNLLTLPLSKEIPELITDISKIMQTPLFYFEQKNTILKEIRKIKQINDNISNSPAMLDEKYIQELTSTNITRKPFETKNTIYLQQISQQYTQSLDQLTSSIQLKKEKLGTLIVNLAEKIDLSYTSQNKKALSVNLSHLEELQKYSEQLQNNELIYRISHIQGKINRAIEYGPLDTKEEIELSPTKEDHKIKTAIVNEPIITTTSSTIPQKHIYQPVEQSTEPIGINQTPIKTIKDLFIVTHQLSQTNPNSTPAIDYSNKIGYKNGKYSLNPIY